MAVSKRVSVGGTNKSSALAEVLRLARAHDTTAARGDTVVRKRPICTPLRNARTRKIEVAKAGASIDDETAGPTLLDDAPVAPPDPEHASVLQVIRLSSWLTDPSRTMLASMVPYCLCAGDSEAHDFESKTLGAIVDVCMRTKAEWQGIVESLEVEAAKVDADQTAKIQLLATRANEAAIDYSKKSFETKEAEGRVLSARKAFARDEQRGSNLDKVYQAVLAEKVDMERFLKDNWLKLKGSSSSRVLRGQGRAIAEAMRIFDNAHIERPLHDELLNVLQSDPGERGHTADAIFAMCEEVLSKYLGDFGQQIAPLEEGRRLCTQDIIAGDACVKRAELLHSSCADAFAIAATAWHEAETAKTAVIEVFVDTTQERVIKFEVARKRLAVVSDALSRCERVQRNRQFNV